MFGSSYHENPYNEACKHGNHIVGHLTIKPIYVTHFLQRTKPLRGGFKTFSKYNRIKS